MTTWMDWVKTLTGLLGVILWPLLVAVVVIAFRKQLKGLLERVSSFKGLGVEAAFARTGAEVAEGLVAAWVEQGPEETSQPGNPRAVPLSQYFTPERFHDSPLNVIIESFIALERWFDSALNSHGIDIRPGFKKLTVYEMAELAVHHGFIEPESLKTVTGLGIMRDIAIGKNGDKVTPQEARSYVTLIDGQIFTMTNQLERYDAEHPR